MSQFVDILTQNCFEPVEITQRRRDLCQPVVLNWQIPQFSIFLQLAGIYPDLYNEIQYTSNELSKAIINILDNIRSTDKKLVQVGSVWTDLIDSELLQLTLPEFFQELTRLGLRINISSHYLDSSDCEWSLHEFILEKPANVLLLYVDQLAQGEIFPKKLSLTKNLAQNRLKFEQLQEKESRYKLELQRYSQKLRELDTDSIDKTSMILSQLAQDSPETHIAKDVLKQLQNKLKNENQKLQQKFQEISESCERVYDEFSGPSHELHMIINEQMDNYVIKLAQNWYEISQNECTQVEKIPNLLPCYLIYIIDESEQIGNQVNDPQIIPQLREDIIDQRITKTVRKISNEYSIRLQQVQTFVKDDYSKNPELASFAAYLALDTNRFTLLKWYILDELVKEHDMESRGLYELSSTETYYMKLKGMMVGTAVNMVRNLELTNQEQKQLENFLKDYTRKLMAAVVANQCMLMIIYENPKVTPSLKYLVAEYTTDLNYYECLIIEMALECQSEESDGAITPEIEDARNEIDRQDHYKWQREYNSIATDFSITLENYELIG